ncbi:MAG: MBL fold metallo-hydrolase [Alphaproteobacteria bacterium]
MHLTLLGSGPSGGVPLITGHWGACDPTNPKNHRRRCSLLIQHNGQNIIIDTSPDIRQQLLDASISNINAVLYTHDHADHTHGIDELRPMYFAGGRTPIPIYGDNATITSLTDRFSYLFAPKDGSERPASYPVILQPNVISTDPVEICGIRFQPFVQDHGYSTTLGYRFGNVAYSTDVLTLDDKAFEVLDGIDYWFVDCLKITPGSHTHSHLERTLSWIERVQPKQAVLIHMNHEMDYDQVMKTTPDNVIPGYDGLELQVGL